VETLDTSCLKRSCKQACADGDAFGCILHAYALQQAEAVDEAQTAFGRSCKLGLAIACTNYGAWLWHKPRSKTDVACAKRMFDKACEVREPFGCGMAGRVLAQGAKTDEQRIDARLHFERVCREIGTMTCRMYALHVEKGDLGPPDPAQVKSLMERACSTGDQDACGHDTASETFR
jgi:TPR repeat protein